MSSEQNTLEQFFEKNSLYIGPEIMKRIKKSFREWLQKQKTVSDCDIECTCPICETIEEENQFLDDLSERLK
jgi:hypothetical protein